jgi:hypothetical protein
MRRDASGCADSLGGPASAAVAYGRAARVYRRAHIEVIPRAREGIGEPRVNAPGLCEASVVADTYPAAMPYFPNLERLCTDWLHHDEVLLIDGTVGDCGAEGMLAGWDQPGGEGVASAAIAASALPPPLRLLRQPAR